MTAGTGKLGLDSLDSLDRTAREESGKYGQDKKERTGWPENGRKTGQLGQDN
jgi:hypothetical protein